MAEKDSLFNSKIRHVGIFDFKDTYRITYEWLIQEGYNIEETNYKEIIGTGGAKEVDIYWDAKKKMSDYFQFHINIRFHPIGMSSVEVDIDGVKQKMNKGDLTIEFKSVLLKDYDTNWEEGNFTKTLRSWYDKYLQQERITYLEGKVMTEMQELIEYLKAYLTLTGRK